MLGCGALVRNIAPPHVRCVCGSACGRTSLKVRAKCVRVGIFHGAMCDRTSHPGGRLFYVFLPWMICWQTILCIFTLDDMVVDHFMYYVHGKMFNKTVCDT